MSDIVITGIGVISPLGVGRESFWAGCREARSGIKKITAFDTDSFDCRIAGCIDDFDPREFMSPRVYRRMSRISRMAVAASLEALEDSGLDLDTMDRERVAVILGTSYGSSSHVEDFYVSLLKEGPRGAQPFLFPETVPNAPASHIAMTHKVTGPNTTFCQNEISAESAILYARDLLTHNMADVVFAGGAEELSQMLFSCYDALGALCRAKVREDGSVQPEPGKGLVLGEGAGILIMERDDHARARDARIYGRIRSGVITGGTAELGHYEREGTQMARAIMEGLKQSGMGYGDIDQIHVSANFSGELDRMEHDRLDALFPDRKDRLEVTPLKYLVGDFGGAGALRAAAILLSLYHRQAPATVGIKTLKASGGPVIWHKNSSDKTATALMTSSTFGGASACLVFTGE